MCAFRALSEALDAGHSAALCVIVSAAGSTPRGAGSAMTVTDAGETAGTIGGGAVELTAASLAREMLQSGACARLERFQLSPGEGLDMACGGEITVLFAPFHGGEELPGAACALLRGSENAWLIGRVKGGKPDELGLYDEASGLRCIAGLTAERLQALATNHPIWLEREEAYFGLPLVVAGRVYLFGGGHVGQALVPFLSRVGFRVTVIDEREDTPARFPDAQRVIVGRYAQTDALDNVSEDDYIVIMTSGHRADYEILTKALQTSATYIGCIGSHRKATLTRERLLADGFSPKDADRVHTPIGLAIGAETPEEIAVSIVGEMIAHRAKRRQK